MIVPGTGFGFGFGFDFGIRMGVGFELVLRVGFELVLRMGFEFVFGMGFEVGIDLLIYSEIDFEIEFDFQGSEWHYSLLGLLDCYRSDYQTLGQRNFRLSVCLLDLLA